MKLSYIYIDSNPLERLHIIQILKHFPEITLKAKFCDAVNANEYLNYNAVDFAIVSSELQVNDVFDFVQQLKDNIEIILLTKEPMDAIKSYEMGFTDCLLKPINKDRLKFSIERLVNKIQFQKDFRKKKERLIHFKCNFKSEKLMINNIRWIEAMGDYVKVVTKSRNYIILSTMKSFLTKLPENQFIRIHKSYIVNLEKVINFSTRNVNIDGELLPVSRKQKREFKETFLNFQ